MAHEAAESGEAVPPIVIVQMTEDAARSSRLGGFNSREGFPVVIRGRDALGPVERTAVVRSVERGLSASRQWSEVVRVFTEQAAWLVSNSGDAGYRVSPEDQSREILEGHRAPKSFPAMLLALLYRRWQKGRSGITLLPCELVRRNADFLRAMVVDLAERLAPEPAFLAWLESECLWINTLVDRIVSEALVPVGAVAEPYALWAIERRSGLELPFAHPDIVLTDDLDRYERLKLHILNLGHTWLAEDWHRTSGPRDATVREWTSDGRSGQALREIYAREVIPGFAVHRMGAQARAYVERTLERFGNPFLVHKLSDIYGSHALKVEKRVAGFIRWVDTAVPAVELARLRSFAARYAPSPRTPANLGSLR